MIDRSDAEDLLNDVRGELSLDKGEVRFPKKGTCLSIYSRCVNAQRADRAGAARRTSPGARVIRSSSSRSSARTSQRKQEQNVLDYDDLLLYWFHLMQERALASEVRKRFDAVLVDEYQDTNALQASILKGCARTGAG